MIKLIIYDLDGTLIDSRLDIANSINWSLQTLKLPTLPPDKIIAFIGHGVVNLIQRTLKEVGRATDPTTMDRMLQIYRKRYDEHLLDETRLYPSVQNVLAHFKDRKQAVVTNKPTSFSLKILEGLGISSYFFRVIGGEQGFPHKPSPESLLALVGEAKVSCSETVLIGDSAIDIQTAHNAGVVSVAVTHGFGDLEEVKAEKPDLIVDSLSKLVDCSILN